MKMIILIDGDIMNVVEISCLVYMRETTMPLVFSTKCYFMRVKVVLKKCLRIYELFVCNVCVQCLCKLDG